MMSCNLIFWTIVIPVTTFGSEICCLTEADCENLNAFQRHIGRRIQRFPSRSPKFSSFYGLGWSRIVTYIWIKKLLFIMSILRLKEDNVVRRVFVKCTEVFNENVHKHVDNINNSPTYDLSNTACKFGLYNLIYEFTSGVRVVPSKNTWTKIIWERAWCIEDTYWSTLRIMHSQSTFMFKVAPKTKYLSWWELADKYPNMINMCELMARLICNSRRLKADDLRLKSSNHSLKVCTACDLYIIEDLRHVIMQCPSTEHLRTHMFSHLSG